MSSAEIQGASFREPKLVATLTRFAEEFRATLRRIMAYLCGLALLALIGTDLASRRVLATDVAIKFLHDSIAISPRVCMTTLIWRRGCRSASPSGIRSSARSRLFLRSLRIFPVKQALMRSCGMPKAAARIC